MRILSKNEYIDKYEELGESLFRALKEPFHSQFDRHIFYLVYKIEWTFYKELTNQLWKTIP